MHFIPGWFRCRRRELRGIGLLLFLTLGTPLWSNPTTTYLGLDFFEGPRQRPSNPTFSRVFDSDEIRYIWCRLHVDNLKSGQGSNPVEFRARIYNTEDNQFVGETSIEYTLPSTWKSAYLYAGWGFDSAGRWDPGIYRMEVYAYDENADYNDFREGYKLFRTQFFQLAPNPNTVSLATDPPFSLYALDFFEGGRTFPEERNLQETFDVTTARTIYTQARVINHSYEQEDISSTIDFVYLRPDGSRLANPSVNMNAKKSWRTVRTSTGWGWADDDPGNWTPATYRVLVYDENFLLGENSFTVVDNRPLSLDYKVRDLGVFSADGSGPLNPDYQTSFSAEDLVFLHLDFKVENPNFEVREHETTFRIRFLRYEGLEETVLSEARLEATFYPSEAEKTLTEKLENPDEEWRPGRYGVEVYRGDKLMNLLYFRLDASLSDVSWEPPQPELPELPVAFTSMRLFSGSQDFVVPEEGDYRTEFSAAETRYLWVDVFLTNERLGEEAFELPVIFKFFHQEEGLFQEVNKTFSIKSDMQTPIVTAAHGFEEAGQWPTGNWRVEAWVGEYKLGTQSFRILPGAPE